MTLEGDSVVMFQQTARDIFKNLSKVIKGKAAKRDFKFLNDFKSVVNNTLEDPDITNPEVLLQIIKASALFQILRTSNELKSKGSTSHNVRWNKLHLVDIIKCSKLHSVYQTALINYEEVTLNKNMSKPLATHLLNLCKVYM